MAYLLTELWDGGVQLRYISALGVELLHLGRGHRFVRLPRGPVHGLDPQDAILLVITCKYHCVSFFDGIEEGSATLQTCTDRKSNMSRAEKIPAGRGP